MSSKTQSHTHREAKRQKHQRDPCTDTGSDQSSEVKQEIKAEVWHKYHNDPLLDVVLLSRDQVLFRASSHVLKRESSLFEGMFSAKPNAIMSAADAIPIDYRSDVIAHFLECCTAQHPLVSAGNYSFRNLRAYDSLVRELDCDRLIPSAERSYLASCHRNPLDWLKAASKDNDIAAAKAALSHCHETKHPLDTDAIFDLGWRIRENWRYPLIQCLKSDALKNRKQAGMVHLSWPDRRRIEKFEEDANRAE